MTIPSIILAKSGITTSRLGFGTSRLHYLGRREQRRLLDAAADLGFVHFDTAPAYGDGQAETALGRFVRGRRDRFVIVTKYGIPPSRVVEAMPALGMPMRAIRALASRLGRSGRNPPPLSAAGLRRGAERSLRRLGVDRVDILLLHEPHPARMERLPEIVEEFIRLRDRGLIRTFGMAGAGNSLSTLLGDAPELGQVIQTAEADWPAGSPPDITYGAIARGAQSYFSPRIDPDAAVARLRSALARRPDGTILISTTNVSHLRSLAEIVDRQSA